MPAIASYLRRPVRLLTESVVSKGNHRGEDRLKYAVAPQAPTTYSTSRMARRWRLLAVVIVFTGAGFAPSLALATHCPPEHYPHPPAVPDDYPCGPSGTQRPPSPTPTPKPATPTPAPTTQQTASPTRRPTTSTTRSTTPAPTAIDDVEVPTQNPLATPEIIVDGPIADDQPLDVAEPSASASSWIFGFIVGLVVGGFVGRASWGLRRRRRQQIFG